MTSSLPNCAFVRLKQENEKGREGLGGVAHHAIGKRSVIRRQLSGKRHHRRTDRDNRQMHVSTDGLLPSHSILSPKTTGPPAQLRPEIAR